MSDSTPPVKKPTAALSSEQRTQPSWDEIADGFETLGKVGLAMAIGMSAAGLFCRLAQQGKVRVPSLSSLVVGREESGAKPRERDS